MQCSESSVRVMLTNGILSRTGNSRARYALDVSSKGQVDLIANVKVNVHYFEDGNVQLNVDFKKTTKVQVGVSRSCVVP